MDLFHTGEFANTIPGFKSLPRVIRQIIGALAVPTVTFENRVDFAIPSFPKELTSLIAEYAIDKKKIDGRRTTAKYRKRHKEFGDKVPSVRRKTSRLNWRKDNHRNRKEGWEFHQKRSNAFRRVLTPLIR
jgi:hypothetical protein